MKLERIADTGHNLYQTALDLYHISFPFHEQREADSQANILHDQEYHFHVIYDKDIFVGMLLYWETERFIYIEHFCILPEFRNMHYGQRILKLLEQQGKIVILEIDPPLDTISNRRKAFYERSGFVKNPYFHIHPPYHRGSPGHKLIIMSSPSEITPEEYVFFKRYLEGRVMKNAYI